MPGAESVTMLFSEWVWMRATWSSSQPSSSPVDSTVTTEVTVADCPEPSLNVALRWYRPGLLKE